MITVLGANAGLDRTYEVPGLRLGGYHHPRRVDVAAGGAKGVNVARLLRALGHEVQVTGFAGGLVGQEMARRLASEGIVAAFVPIAGDSRLCLNLVDPETGRQTQIDEVGPTVTSRETRALVERWQELLAGSRLAIISGSPPPGTRPAVYRRLVALARKSGVPVFVDARDGYLSAAMSAEPDLVRVNREEFGHLVGARLRSWQAIARRARELVVSGIGAVVVSWGARGALGMTADGAWLARPPAVRAVSAVGSGDAMLATLAHGALGALAWPERLRLAVAAGAANAEQLGPCRIGPQHIRTFLDRVECEPLGL
ncbi:MAG: hexose kinase [Armatimonadetes bacterium]|nr:hexose kinase [Armatimonadota bacterium]